MLSPKRRRATAETCTKQKHQSQSDRTSGYHFAAAETRSANQDDDNILNVNDGSGLPISCDGDDNSCSSSSHSESDGPISQYNVVYENHQQSSIELLIGDKIPLENGGDEFIQQESPHQVTLTKAKRARVENIVTYIKDKPNKSPPSNNSNKDSEPTTKCDLSNYDYDATDTSQSKKRRRSEQIGKLQQKLPCLQDEYECKSKSFESPEGDKATHDSQHYDSECKQAFSSDGSVERLSQRTRTQELIEGQQHRRFQGAPNSVFPQNDENDEVMEQHEALARAYKVLVNSLKRELSAVLGEVAEKSAKRVLEAFQRDILDIDNSASNDLLSYDELSKQQEDYNDCKKRKHETIHRVYQGKKQTSDDQSESDNDEFQDNIKLHDTTSQSLQHLIHLRTRRVSNAGHNMHSQPASMLSKVSFDDKSRELWKNGETCGWENVDTTESSESSRNYPEVDTIQTEALPLVVRKSFSSSPKSVTSGEDVCQAPFDSKPKLPINLTRSKQESKSENISIQNSYSSTNSKHRLSFQRTPSPHQHKLTTSSRHQSSTDYSMPSGSTFFSPFSAFKPPFYHRSLTPSPHKHFDVNLPPNAIRSPSLSFYSGVAQQPQSLYPFSSAHLPLPVLQGLHHGAYATAFYDRFRERLGSGLPRSLSTRTSTRESKASGMNKECNKTDAANFRNSMLDVSPYSASSIQDGLTPQHLKKAKLMFFYTRYPSASTLKIFFSDVNFTRATTSQLIKWFSNFREFFYIQMEKFARLALSEGLSDVNQLQVTRNSELFRVLSQHYDKSNDFRVPDQFIEVSLKSLKEFFLAIQSGKDHDPSWKKVIYKVICKFDENIPKLFKSSNILEHLNEI